MCSRLAGCGALDPRIWALVCLTPGSPGEGLRQEGSLDRRKRQDRKGHLSTTEVCLNSPEQAACLRSTNGGVGGMKVYPGQDQLHHLWDLRCKTNVWSCLFKKQLRISTR